MPKDHRDSLDDEEWRLFRQFKDVPLYNKSFHYFWNYQHNTKDGYVKYKGVQIDWNASQHSTNMWKINFLF